MPESRVHVRVHTEEIEVTRDGTLPPFKADVARKFIPGLTTFFVTIDGEELPPMTPIEFMQQYPVRHLFTIGEYDVCRDCFLAEADK